MKQPAFVPAVTRFIADTMLCVIHDGGFAPISLAEAFAGQLTPELFVPVPEAKAAQPKAGGGVALGGTAGAGVAVGAFVGGGFGLGVAVGRGVPHGRRPHMPARAVPPKSTALIIAPNDGTNATRTFGFCMKPNTDAPPAP